MTPHSQSHCGTRPLSIGTGRCEVSLLSDDEAPYQSEGNVRVAALNIRASSVRIHCHDFIAFNSKILTAQPHASVSTSNFHKHIDRELPEAHRARHLLVWCASRSSARSKPGSSSEVNHPPLPPLTAEGTAILHEVQKEILKMLTEQRIDTSLSSRADGDGDRPKVKQHEQNVRNLKREDDFMRHIDRLVFRFLHVICYLPCFVY